MCFIAIIHISLSSKLIYCIVHDLFWIASIFWCTSVPCISKMAQFSSPCWYASLPMMRKICGLTHSCRLRITTDLPVMFESCIIINSSLHHLLWSQNPIGMSGWARTRPEKKRGLKAGSWLQWVSSSQLSPCSMIENGEFESWNIDENLHMGIPSF